MLMSILGVLCWIFILWFVLEVIGNYPQAKRDVEEAKRIAKEWADHEAYDPTDKEQQ